MFSIISCELGLTTLFQLRDTSYYQHYSTIQAMDCLCYMVYVTRWWYWPRRRHYHF